MRGVAAVDGDDAAAGVGAGSAEEHAGHRGPVSRRLSHMYAGRHSPWKMCPPVRPTFCSISGGPSTWTSSTASGMLLAEPADRAERQVC